MKRVVVTGLGLVSPLGSRVNEFWDNLKKGVNGIGEITYFDTKDFKVKIAGQAKGFDPSDYLEKSEIRRTDLFAQYAIGAASQAFEDSKIDLNKIDENRFGVYVGSGIGGINTFYTEVSKLADKGPKRVSPFFVPMMIANIAGGLISIRYGAKGPCLPIVTACATGSHSIGEAYRNIKHGYSDIIIAGGAEAAITEIALAGFTNSMALSTTNDPNRSSLPFHLKRDGFVMGEGAGILILEEYEHAKRRGAKIYAEIKSYGNTCDGHHITAPDPQARYAAKAIEIAANEAYFMDKDLSKLYINAHGTGTPLNDVSETKAIKKVFEKRAYDIAISSTKSMTGHMLGAAGALEAICSILTIRDGIVPPTINLTERDPECDLDYTANQAREREIDYSLSISLGFGGHNACIAFERMREDGY